MSQMDVLLSADPDTKKFVKGWKLRPLTESVWDLNYCLILRELRSNSLMHPSPEPERIKSPVSWNLSFHIGPVCTSVKVWAIEELIKSQTLIDLSPPPVVKCDPAGWKSIAAIQSLWPSPVMMFSWFSRFQIFQVQSSPAVATIYFLAWSAIPPIPLGWASIFFWQDILSLKFSKVSDKYGFGLASSGHGVF